MDLAKEYWGINDDTRARDLFISEIKRRERYFNMLPFPSEESNENAFIKCFDADSAKKHCPQRWKAMQDWIKSTQKVTKLDFVAVLSFTSAEVSYSHRDRDLQMQQLIHGRRGLAHYFMNCQRVEFGVCFTKVFCFSLAFLLSVIRKVFILLCTSFLLSLLLSLFFTFNINFILFIISVLCDPMIHTFYQNDSDFHKRI